MNDPRRDEGDDRDEAESLRRRLYQRDVTPDDLSRYETVATADVLVEDRAPETASKRDRRTPIVVAGLLVAIVAAAGVAVSLSSAHQTRAVSTTPSDTGSTWTMTFTGTATRTSPPEVAAAQPLAVDAATRAGFLAALRNGTPVSIAGYLVAHPDARLAGSRAVTRADSVERTGAGPASIELAPSPAAQRGGQVTVFLVTDHDGLAGWTALRDDDRDDRAPYQGSVGARSGLQRAGVPTTATVAYDSPAPVRLDITVGAGVRWGVLVDFTD